MTWPFTQRTGDLSATAETLIGDRTNSRLGIGTKVSRDQALRNSAVWACLRLRADLISTLPIDVYRRVGKVQVEQAKPPVLIAPGGKKVRAIEWMYSTQWDLDSVGNTVGVITARDGLGLPAEIQLANMDGVTFIGKGSELKKVRIGTTEYDPSQIWHEKQFTVSGIPIGLSPIAYAAMSLNAGLSAQQFTVDWFTNSTTPGGHLKNTGKVLKRAEAQRVKQSFKESVSSGDVWVSGMDWEYSMLAAKASESQFLETQKASVVDVCRYLGVPGDVIDAETATGSITYANVTQRNLQLLIINLGPAITRREDAISAGLLPQPRYIKLNVGALLRMDTTARMASHKVAIDSRIYPPSRALDMENMAPLTPEEIAEFATLFPVKTLTPSVIDKES
jgi:HK97 family phage portal protein